jgi:hypothetical protein
MDIEKGRQQQKKRKSEGFYGLLAHNVITLVLMAAPATPLTRAKTMFASTCRIVANASATVGDAKNARNPIANPIAPKTASIPVLDTILHHC